MEFHDYLYDLRKQKGWSQEQLGAQINVTRQTVSKWETGETTPEMGKLIELGELFGVSLDELAGRTTQKEPQLAVACRLHYEYKSKAKLFGLPLVHVHVGWGMCRAKGIVAVGNMATGLVAIGGVSAGILSFGGLSAGIFSLGGLALALLLSLGGISIGTVAVGGCAVGIFAVGGFALGVYSLGGCAVASKIAGGGFAKAYLAIGEKTSGVINFSTAEGVSSSKLREAILTAFPNTWRLIVDFFTSIF